MGYRVVIPSFRSQGKNRTDTDDYRPDKTPGRNPFIQVTR